MASSSSSSMPAGGAERRENYKQHGRGRKHLESDFSADMPLHSFEAPLSIDQLDQHWLTSGATTGTDNRIVLNPDIANRFGLFWHKEPVLSRKFDVETTMIVSKFN